VIRQVAATACLAALALAPTAARADAPITEEQAVAIALRESPALRALAHELEESRALVGVAVKLSNPELEVSGLRSDRLVEPALDDEPYSDYPLGRIAFGLQWRPPNLGARTARRAQAERRSDQVAADLEEERRQMVARVRTLHATALGLDAQIALAEATLEQRDQLRTLIGKRLQAQAATVLDQSLSDLDYLDTLATLQELESKRRQVQADLLVYLNLRPDAQVELAGSTRDACIVAAISPDAAIERAKSNSYRLKAFDARLAEADAQESRLHLELLPWFDKLRLSYVLRGQNNPAYFALQSSVPLPVLDRNGPDLRALSAHRSSVADQRQAEERDLASRVRRTLAEQTQQVTLAKRYREAEPVVEESLVRLRRALEVGEADLLQIATLQTRVLAARRARLRAELECHLSEIELDRLLGPPVSAR